MDLASYRPVDLSHSDKKDRVILSFSKAYEALCWWLFYDTQRIECHRIPCVWMRVMSQGNRQSRARIAGISLSAAPPSEPPP